MTHAPTSLDLEQEVKDLFERKMREFIAFCANNWQLTVEDQIDIDDQPASPDYLRGYNAGITDGISGALDFWLDQEGYGR